MSYPLSPMMICVQCTRTVYYSVSVNRVQCTDYYTVNISTVYGVQSTINIHCKHQYSVQSTLYTVSISTVNISVFSEQCTAVHWQCNHYIVGRC